MLSEMMENCPNTVPSISIKTLFCRDMNYYNMMGDLLYFELNLLNGGLKKRDQKQYGDTVIDQKSDGTIQWSKDNDTINIHRTHLGLYIDGINWLILNLVGPPSCYMYLLTWLVSNFIGMFSRFLIEQAFSLSHNHF